jgi:hypothetical protein
MNRTPLLLAACIAIQYPKSEIRNPKSEIPPPPEAPMPPSADGQPRSRHQPQPTLDQTPRRGLPWLWPGRIPIGRVTLLVGDPGVGKSLLALDVAARVTAAKPWPDQAGSKEHGAGRDDGVDEPPDTLPLQSQPTTIRTFPPLAPCSLHPALSSAPATVLILSAEDDPADTIRPRLEAVNADLARIVALPPGWSPDDPAGVWDGAPEVALFGQGKPHFRTLDLTRDVAVLDDVIERQGDVRLVIIDPLGAYLGGHVENSSGPVRRVLLQLGRLAAHRKLAVLAICHLRKQSGSALHRTMGSLAFTAASRAAWLVARDPAAADRRLMLPMKNNLGGDSQGLAFTIAAAGPEDAAAIDWLPDPVALSADAALNPTKPPKAPPPRPQPELDDAVRWLNAELADGVQSSRRIDNRATAHGIRPITLRRAFRVLGGEAVRTGFGPLGTWHWRLPGVGPQEPDKNADFFGDDW